MNFGALEAGITISLPLCGFLPVLSALSDTSNVLYYEMTDGAWVCVRPSGTEPKVKFYLGVKGTSLADADQKSADLSKAVHAMIDKML